MGTSQINIPFTLLHIVCAVVSPTGSRPPSRNRNNEMPGDEELGFVAAVAALGKKYNFPVPSVLSGIDSYINIFSVSLFIASPHLSYPLSLCVCRYEDHGQ